MKLMDVTMNQTEELRLNKTNLSDYKTMGREDHLREKFKLAREVISKGGVVIIEQRYENAPPDIIERISSEKRLNEIERGYLLLGGAKLIS